jgi:hypothetical protein
MELHLFPGHEDQCLVYQDLRPKHNISYHHHSPHPASLTPLLYCPAPSPIFPPHIRPPLKVPPLFSPPRNPSSAILRPLQPLRWPSQKSGGHPFLVWPQSECTQLCPSLLPRPLRSRKGEVHVAPWVPSCFYAFVSTFVSSWRTAHCPSASKSLLISRPQLRHAAWACLERPHFPSQWSFLSGPSSCVQVYCATVLLHLPW